MEWKQQGFRYVVVGIASNAALYLVYLGLTALGLGPKSAMTVLYIWGTLQTFLFNRAWTFRHRGAVRRSLTRYFAAYLGCYVLNLIVLHVLVDRIGMPHAVVQGCAILGTAALLFVILRTWVFPAGRTPDTRLVDPT